ncbi:lytic polysaccharide monooxygenase [Streptomyces sp. C10-9-1]|uniref:lytic polysaccharide monooxygenase n=1 Tax=Streptomyces sp. C10-9-1 TaxID=1859285 RepID=UPI0021125C63|nr:lytic polysaccharide monooxygenase [Streptomyces sp. C10-9-1]MCQ6554834.1 lytic polysaccharide monooxygenase [Streptomyces sp. C10-9-1]
MNAKKRKTSLLAGALLAPVLAVGLPASTAHAHGWVTSPASRQDQCASGVVDCGQIRYEPQSVEGPKGLRSCSGGNAQFAELDDDGKGWHVTPVGSTYTFTWHHTARHATESWQYFLGDRMIASFTGNGARPPADVSHQVDFGGVTGRQKVLAVWNVADTGNAFYSCIDVSIGDGDGGGDGGGDGEPGACVAPSWNAGSIYTGGDTVSYGGHTWRAKWWVTGEQPGTTGEWGVWEDLGACAAG